MTPDATTLLVLLLARAPVDWVEGTPQPLVDGVMAADGSRLLHGVDSARQRLADALRIQRGSYPLLRDYGSVVGLAVDRRPAAIYAAVADAIRHPANGLGDVRLLGVRLSPDGAGQVVAEVDAEWAEPGGQPVPISVREQLAAKGGA